MRIEFFGGLRLQARTPHTIVGDRQQALLFRLAIDAGTVVSIRSLTEDLWPTEVPDNSKAALQSLVSRLRAQLPPDSIVSLPGGYRLDISRADVDVLRFQDAVSRAESAPSRDQPGFAGLALAEWTGEPWMPHDSFDWYLDELLADRSRALELGGIVPPPSVRSTTFRAPPLPLTALIGRETELELVRIQLTGNRLVTIVGTGGAGKTRLAIEVARPFATVVYVELAPVAPLEIRQAVLSAAGREIRSADATASEPVGMRDRLLDALGGREVLLVLDNCEHLSAAAAELALDLLAALPQLTVLATSREPIGIVGEAFVQLGPLDHVASADIDRAPNDESVADTAAVRLFAQRTLAARAAPLARDERVLAARICARLDGLPFAIELAAARARTLGIGEIADGLDDRFSLLDGGRRSGVLRHQTLGALIDWSWGLLDDSERAALCALAVFPAGMSVADAPAALAALQVPIAGVLDDLVDKSLVQRVAGRFRTLETIREYGLARLGDAGKLAAARTAHATLFAQRASLEDSRLRTANTSDAIAWFDTEYDNIVGALRFALDSGLHEIALGLAVTTSWYWIIRDRNQDAAAWYLEVAPVAADVDSPVATLVSIVFEIATSGFGDPDADGDLQGARVVATAALQRLADIDPVGRGDLVELIVPLVRAFATAMQREDRDWMLTVAIPRGDDLGIGPWPTAMLDVARAVMAENRGEIAEHARSAALGVERFESLGDEWALALARHAYAESLSLAGRLDEALVQSELSADGMRGITSAQDLLQQRGLALSILIRLWRLAEARERVDNLVAFAVESGSSGASVHALCLAITLEIAEKRITEAREYLARIDAILPGVVNLPPQLEAAVDLERAQVDVLDGDFVSAGVALRRALDAAIRSRDQPVIASVGLGAAAFALATGDPVRARGALALATAIRGALEISDPRVAMVLAALGESGEAFSDSVFGGGSVAGAASVGRVNAIEALDSLLGN